MRCRLPTKCKGGTRVPRQARQKYSPYRSTMGVPVCRDLSPVASAMYPVPAHQSPRLSSPTKFSKARTVARTGQMSCHRHTNCLVPCTWIPSLSPTLIHPTLHRLGQSTLPPMLQHVAPEFQWPESCGTCVCSQLPTALPSALLRTQTHFLHPLRSYKSSEVSTPSPTKTMTTTLGFDLRSNGRRQRGNPSASVGTDIFTHKKSAPPSTLSSPDDMARHHRPHVPQP